jgi:hypothetical protein
LYGGKMQVAEKMLSGVLVVVIFLCLCSTARAQNSPYGPPSDQVYFALPNGSSNYIWNYSSNTTTEPPVWNYYAIGGPAVLANSPLTSFSYGTEDLVYYIGTDGHIHEDQWDTRNGPSYVDITTASGAPLPATGSALTSILDGEHGYIYYIGTDMHAHQITWTSSGSWVTTDITTTAGAASAGYVNSLASFIFGGDLEVVYVTAANHVIQVYLNSGSSWATLDMTSLSGAPLAEPATGLTGFKYPDGHAHVYYFPQPVSGGTVSLGELYQHGSTWGYDNLSSIPIPAPANYKSLTSLSFGSSIRVYYETPSAEPTVYSEVIEYHAADEGPGFNTSNGWNFQNIMSGVGSLYPANANSTLASYVNTSTSPQSVRLYYVSSPDVVGTQYQGQPYVTQAYGVASSGLDLTWNWDTIGNQAEPPVVTGTFW